MKWTDILEIAALMFLLGMFLAGVYEVVALINLKIPFTPNFPPITYIVRPWVAANKNGALAIACVWFAAQIWLFFHFFLNL